jgi:hypothetical protein
MKDIFRPGTSSKVSGIECNVEPAREANESFLKTIFKSGS